MFHDFSSRPGGRGSFHTKHHASPLHSSHRSAFSQTNNSDTTSHPPRWLRWPWGSLPRNTARIQHITVDNTKAWLTTLSARPAISAWERGTPCSYTNGFECASFCMDCMQKFLHGLQNTYKGTRPHNTAPLQSIPQGKEKDGLFDGGY